MTGRQQSAESQTGLVDVYGEIDWTELLAFQDTVHTAKHEYLGGVAFTIRRDVEDFRELAAGTICMLALRTYKLRHELELSTLNYGEDEVRKRSGIFEVGGICSLFIDGRQPEALRKHDSPAYVTLDHVGYVARNSSIPALQDEAAYAVVNLPLHFPKASLRVV